VIERDEVDGIAVVRMSAGKVNALDLELVRAITATFVELDSSAVRAIVFTGAGRAFSAGVDLWRVVDGGEDYVRAFLPALVECFETVFGTGKPVVAAVNGHAVAGGCILVSCCDRRIMADAPGRIGVTELAVGVPFPVSALEILRFAAGAERARAAVLDADAYLPEVAVHNGLVDEVVGAEELARAALAAAARLADRVPPDTFRLTKRQLRADVLERIGQRRPVEDPQTTALWLARVQDGHIREYMRRVTGRA
jgi:enoyl-CoA hydratase